MVEVILPLGSQTIPSFSCKLLTSQNSYTQLTELAIRVIQSREGPHRKRPSIIACYFVAEEVMCPHSCPIATAAVLSPAYTAVIWK
jgi:hypothetical protein